MSLIDQIAQTLGDTNGTLIAAIETNAIEHLDFELECQGNGHPHGWFGHNPEQKASWQILGPCGLDVLICQAWVTDHITREHVGVICSHCTCPHDNYQLRFIPLNPTDKP